MHAVLSSLTAAVLFIHTVFGCCWHHAQACQPLAAVAQPARCCEHHQQPGDGQQPEQPSRCCVECEGTCAYVLPQKVQIEAPQAVASFDLAATLPLLADAQMVSASAREIGDCSHGAAPPVRLHLLHQLLLN